jgi:hypothetical protein
MNILEAILRLHGARGTLGSPRESAVAELLGHPDKLVATFAAFTAAENAINRQEATEKSEAFTAIFNFVKSGEQPRAMAAGEKDAIQTELSPFISTAVRQALADRSSSISYDQTDDFVRVLTSPELHDEAA